MYGRNDGPACKEEGEPERLKIQPHTDNPSTGMTIMQTLLAPVIIFHRFTAGSSVCIRAA
jgi:hypothetical protein